MNTSQFLGVMGPCSWIPGSRAEPTPRNDNGYISDLVLSPSFSRGGSLAEGTRRRRGGPYFRDIPRPVAVCLGSRARRRRELHGRRGPQTAAQLFRSSADRVVDGLGSRAFDRQREPGRRAAAVYRAVRGYDISDVPPDFGLVQPGGGFLGRGRAESDAAFRHHQRQLGIAGWPAARRSARGCRLPRCRIALRQLGRLGLV